MADQLVHFWISGSTAAAALGSQRLPLVLNSVRNCHDCPNRRKDSGVRRYLDILVNERGFVDLELPRGRW